MSYRDARKLAAAKRHDSFEGRVYIGNVVQDGRAANGEKRDPNGYYVQFAVPGTVNQGKSGKYDMVLATAEE